MFGVLVSDSPCWSGGLPVCSVFLLRLFPCVYVWVGVLLAPYWSVPWSISHVKSELSAPRWRKPGSAGKAASHLRLLTTRWKLFSLNGRNSSSATTLRVGISDRRPSFWNTTQRTGSTGMNWDEPGPLGCGSALTRACWETSVRTKCCTTSWNIREEKLNQNL